MGLDTPKRCREGPVCAIGAPDRIARSELGRGAGAPGVGAGCGRSGGSPRLDIRPPPGLASRHRAESTVRPGAARPPRGDGARPRQPRRGPAPPRRRRRQRAAVHRAGGRRLLLPARPPALPPAPGLVGPAGRSAGRPLPAGPDCAAVGPTGLTDGEPSLEVPPSGARSPDGRPLLSRVFHDRRGPRSRVRAGNAARRSDPDLP